MSGGTVLVRLHSVLLNDARTQPRQKIIDQGPLKMITFVDFSLCQESMYFIHLV